MYSKTLTVTKYVLRICNLSGAVPGSMGHASKVETWFSVGFNRVCIYQPNSMLLNFKMLSSIVTNMCS